MKTANQLPTITEIVNEIIHHQALLMIGADGQNLMVVL